ncbi:MAG: chitobiase/beta-hexosaminidase C-terminal domain-containing protein [Tepidanaerobacteraceae bacterium]
MNKRIISWLLIFVILFQLNGFNLSFASEDTETKPEIYFGQTDWGGGYPVVGDNYLYMQVFGKKLSTIANNFNATLYVEESGDYIEVGSSTESIYLGVNERDEDVYVLKLELNDGKSLEETYYYVQIFDDENNDFTKIEYLLYPNPVIVGRVSGISISEITDDLDRVYIETVIEDFKPGQTKEAFDLELVQGYDGLDPTDDIYTVGEIIPKTLVLDELIGGSYSLKGEFSIDHDDLDPEQPLYVKVIGPGKAGSTDVAYSDRFSRIAVLPSTSPMVVNLDIFNSYSYKSSGDHHGHGDVGSSELGVYFINLNENKLDFSFVGNAMSDASKVDLRLKSDDDIVTGELDRSSLKVKLQDNGTYLVKGTVEFDPQTNRMFTMLNSEDTVGDTVYAEVYDSSFDIHSESSYKKEYNLDIYYDNVLIKGGRVVATDVKGAESIGYEDGTLQPTYYDPYQLYKDDSIEIVIINALNIDPSLLTAKLTKKDSPSETIDLDIDYDVSGLDINLKLTPSDTPLGDYEFELKHDGEDIRYIGIFLGEVNLYEPILYAPVYFNFHDDASSLLKSIENQDNTLTLTGKRFSSSKSYVAYFVKHLGASLNAEPFNVSATVKSSTKLTIAKEDLAFLPRGWYTVYLEEDGERVKGICDVALLYDKDTVDVVLPSAKINNGAEYTLTPEVTINISPGSFSEVKIAGSEEALESAPWQAIASDMPYTLEGEFGTKTIYLCFRTADGFEYATSVTINYSSALLSEMLSYGITGANIKDGIAHLYNKASYDFYIQADSRELTGYVEFLNDSGEIIKTETLRRTSGSNLLHTYSKQINITDELLPASSVSFYIRNDLLDISSKAETMSISISNAAFIANYRSGFKTVLLDKQYVLKGSEVALELWGTPGFNASAVLHYNDNTAYNSPQSKTISLNQTINEGQYEGTAALSDDAAQITKLEYILEDPDNPANKATYEENKSLDITSTLEFIGLENAKGDYNGKVINISREYSWFSEDIVIDNNKSSFIVPGLQAGNYNYLLRDDNRIYKEGDFTAKKGTKTTINLSDTQIPAKVKIELKGLAPDDKNQVRLYQKLNNYPYKRYIEAGEDLSGFIVGDSFTYGIEMADVAAKKYKNIEETKVTISDRQFDINIDLQVLETVELKGTITDERISDQSLADVNVRIVQNNIKNGSYSFKHISNVVTDERGNYSARVYPDVQMEITFSKAGYTTEVQNLTISDNQSLDKGMSPSTQKRLIVQPFVRSMLKPDEAADDSQLLGIDINGIKNIELSSMEGKYLYAPFYRQSGYLDLSYIEGYENKDIKVKVSFFDYPTEEEEYITRLDAYRNGVVKPVAVPYGELRAQIVTGNGNAHNAYLLLYDNKGRQALYMESTGSIITTGAKLEAGNYLALFFKGFDLDRLKEYISYDSFELLDLVENVDYIKKEITIAKGRITDVGEIDIPEILMAEKLGTSNTRISARYEPGTGDLRVLAQIAHEGLGENKSFEQVSLETNGTVIPGSIQIDGTGIPGNATTAIPPDPKKSATTLYFSIIPSSEEETYLSLKLTYKVGEEYIYETISVDNLNMPEVTLVAPSQVLMGTETKKILVRGLSEPGSTIKIYDNDQLIGETTTPDNKRKYQTTVELPNSTTPGVHLLYAKMITEEKEVTTGYALCEIIDPGVMAYTSHFSYSNSGSELFSVESLDDSSKPVTATYVPYHDSTITFRINNLLKADLSYVAFLNTYYGEKSCFEAEHVKDVDNGNEKYSEWKVVANIGMPGKFSVYYSLAEDKPLGPISGTLPIDFEEAIKDPVINPAYVPTSILQSSGRTVSQDGENLNIQIPVANGGYLKLEGSFKEIQGVDIDDLLASGYTQIDTLQGPYWTKESLVELNNGEIRYNRRIYFSPGLVAIMKDEFYSKQAAGPLKRMSLGQASGSDMHTQSVAQDGVGVADYTCYVYNLADFTAHTGGNASGFGIGTHMQVLGGVTLAAQALSGPAGKDENTLYQALEGIKDWTIRDRIWDDIWEYARARRNSHVVSTILNGASYGSGFGGLVGKGLSYIISSGSMIYSKKTGTELDIWWDAIMRDILNELKLQEYREKDKYPGKEDDIKDPDWKIDPSGYVFEAIDSNRVEGITAYALIGDPKADDSFVIWADAEDWGEINPDITDRDGKYGWDVPMGTWKVKFVGNEDYKTSYTKSMEVPPIHEEVNIGLISKRAPKLVDMALDNFGLEVEFDSFMQLESIFDEAHGTNNIAIYDSRNNPIPWKEAEMVIGTKDRVYKDMEENVYQTDYISSEYFVKRVRLLVDDIVYPGGFREFKDDGVTQETYRVVISDNVQSYSGVRMDAPYEDASLVVKEKGSLPVPVASKEAGTYFMPIELDFSTVTGGTIYYTSDGTTPTTLSRVWKDPMKINASTTIKLLASKTGFYDSDVVTYEYRIAKEPIDIAEKPEASISSGTYSKAITVALSSRTAGATIRYTLDGSIPTISSPIYTEPIRISQTTTLRAVAMKDSYVNSSVATFNYIISSSGGSSGSGSGSGSETTPVTPTDEGFSYNEADKTLEIKLKGEKANNQKIYKLSDENCAELLSAIDTKSSDAIVIRVDSIGSEANIYQLPVSFLYSLSSTNTKLRIEADDLQLILDSDSLQEFAAINKTNLSLEVQRVGNQYSISLRADQDLIKLQNNSIVVAIPKAPLGPEWVLAEGDRMLSYSFYSDGFVWGAIRESTTLSLINNLKSFEDNSGWFEDAVKFVTARELFRGTADNSFSPNLSMTRAMLVTVLHRLSNSELPVAPSRNATEFDDVSENDYYFDSVNWAYSLGIISGMGNQRFAPSDSITREQLAVMLYNYAKAHNLLGQVDGSSQQFDDSDLISSWAKEAIDYAVKTGLMKGKGNNILDPKGYATRAEVATMLQNFIIIHSKY